LTLALEMASSELVAKKNANAPVWAHFGFRQDDKGEPTNLDEPLCRICNKKVAAKDSNTTNLKSHLKNSHPITYARLGLNAATTSSRASSADSGSGKKMQQPGIIGAFTKANVTKYPKGSVRRQHCIDLVTHHITKGMQPFRVVEKPHFKNM
ncbi:Zinc finger BED domaincontaining protein 1like, partial [Caligus rogercresseyi]